MPVYVIEGAHLGKTFKVPYNHALGIFIAERNWSEGWRRSRWPKWLLSWVRCSSCWDGWEPLRGGWKFGLRTVGRPARNAIQA